MMLQPSSTQSIKCSTGAGVVAAHTGVGVVAADPGAPAPHTGVGVAGADLGAAVGKVRFQPCFSTERARPRMTGDASGIAAVERDRAALERMRNDPHHLNRQLTGGEER